MLWMDDDFLCLKLDRFGFPVTERQVSVEEGVKRSFRAWNETWEKAKIGPKGSNMHEAKMINKYGGLQFLDEDKYWHLTTIMRDKMWFEKKRGSNGYHLLCVSEMYDGSKPDDEQHDEWEIVETSTDLYSAISEYYNTNPMKGVKCIAREDDGCVRDSDSDE